MDLFNIIASRRKIMLVGCSHGKHLSKVNREAVLTFRDNFKPDDVWHLGDALDTAAFRLGAQGSSDEAVPVRPDISTGMQFLKELGVTMFFQGNHEARLWDMAKHYNAIKKEAAQGVIDGIEKKLKKLRCPLVPYHVQRGWRPFGDFLAGHGYMFNEQACRDHAEALCSNVVFAHTHKTGVAKARTIRNSTGINVGTLADIPNMDYASRRRATLAWNPGICWGEYSDKKAQLWLHEQNSNDPTWLLPV